MKCPSCGEYMYSKKIRGIDLDFCPSCRGTWFDHSELAAALQTKSDLHASSIYTSSTRTEMECPVCTTTLYHKAYAQHFDVEVDQCHSCSGIFVDKGEITKIKEFNKNLQEKFTEYKRKRMQKSNEQKKKLSNLYKSENPVLAESLLVRKTFIQKVYGLLAISLFISALFAYIGILLNIRSVFLIQCLVVGYFAIFGLLLWFRRKKVLGLTLLLSYAAITGFILSFSLMHYMERGLGHLIWLSLFVTALLFFGLSFYVHNTRKDFSAWSGFLYCGLWLIIGTSICYILFPMKILSIVNASAGILIFCGYILLDTSKILLKFNTDEYILATLELYLDIVNLFLDILRLLGEKD
ncbi:MAG: Bax inhibitor-1 family protein [Spirochaetota bacterium]